MDLFKLFLISILVVMAILVQINAASSPNSSSFEQYENGLFAKLLARQSRSSDEVVKRSRQLYKKNLRDCETVEECKELFKFLINTTGERKPPGRSNENKPFKWGR